MPSINKPTNHTVQPLDASLVSALAKYGIREGKKQKGLVEEGRESEEWKRCIVTAQHLNECVFLGMLAPALKHENEHRL